jgi:hypothetical protein
MENVDKNKPSPILSNAQTNNSEKLLRKVENLDSKFGAKGPV